MTAEKKENITEFTRLYLQLDPLSRMLVQSNVTTLLMRDQMEEVREKEPAEPVQQ